MAFINAKAAKHIAVLINTVRVSDGFIKDAKAENDNAKLTRWLEEKAKAAVTLRNQYGIELAGVTTLEKWLNDRKLSQMGV